MVAPAAAGALDTSTATSLRDVPGQVDSEQADVYLSSACEIEATRSEMMDRVCRSPSFTSFSPICYTNAHH